MGGEFADWGPQCSQPLPIPDGGMPQQSCEQPIPEPYQRPQQHAREQLLTDSVLSVAAALSAVHWGGDGASADCQFRLSWAAAARRKEVLEWLAVPGDVH